MRSLKQQPKITEALIFSVVFEWLRLRVQPLPHNYKLTLNALESTIWSRLPS